MKNVSMNGIFSRNVEIFISLSKTKSFQKTASIFGLSTSSISRELVTLENKLKVTLVDRSYRPLILTPEGRKLLSELIPIMNESQRAVALAREASNFHPSLRIGFIDSFSYDVCSTVHYCDAVKNIKVHMFNWRRRQTCRETFIS